MIIIENRNKFSAPGATFWYEYVEYVPYHEWIRSLGGELVYPTEAEPGPATIKFENDNDAIMFKLMYM